MNTAKMTSMERTLSALGHREGDREKLTSPRLEDSPCLLRVLDVTGNLNGVDMINWDYDSAEAHVKHVLSKAGQGGGLILSDGHGEIPYQVPEEALLGIRDAVDKWGTYPLEWVDRDGKA